jgi:magnesium transporter
MTSHLTPKPAIIEIPSLSSITPSLDKFHWPHFVHDWHWVLGAFIAVLAAFISNFGLNLQKLAHLELAYDDPLKRTGEKNPEKRQSYLLNPRWMTGLALTVLGSIADFAALAFAAQSLVAILGSFTLVANILLAPLMLNEKVSKTDVRAVMMIVIGCMIAVSFGQHESKVHTLDNLLYMFGRVPMILYSIGTCIIIGTLWLTIQYIEATYSSGDGDFRYTYKNKSRAHKLHRFLYPAMSGVVGAQSVLFGKVTAEILKGSLVHHKNVFENAMTWIVLIALVTCILTQIRWLNNGLQLFDAMYVVPIFQTFWILVSVLGGLVYFDEWKHFSPFQAIMFPIGIAVTVRGVIELTKRGDDDDDEDEDSKDNNDNNNKKIVQNGKFSVNGGVSGYVDSTMRRQSASSVGKKKEKAAENEDEEAGVADPLLKKSD